jgi:hypothetical protein
LVTAGNTAALSGGKVDISSSVQDRRVYWAGDALRIEGATIGEVAGRWNPSEQPKIVVDDPAGVARLQSRDGACASWLVCNGSRGVPCTRTDATAWTNQRQAPTSSP